LLEDVFLLFLGHLLKDPWALAEGVGLGLAGVVGDSDGVILARAWRLDGGGQIPFAEVFLDSPQVFEVVDLVLEGGVVFELEPVLVLLLVELPVDLVLPGQGPELVLKVLIPLLKMVIVL